MASTAERRVEAFANRATADVGLDLMGASQRDAPLDEGTLRGSAHMTVVERPNGARAVVSFNTVYAARQHEELTWEHPRGGKARYLADNLFRKAEAYRRALVKAQRRALGIE